MLRYTLRRLLLIFPTLLGILTINFFIVQTAPGGPVEQFIAMLEGSGSARYNLGNGAGYSVLEVIETARRVTGHPIPAVMRPRRPGDPACLVAGAAKAREVLGWQPRHPDLKTIVQHAWNWHRAHPHGYRSKA